LNDLVSVVFGSEAEQGQEIRSSCVAMRTHEPVFTQLDLPPTGESHIVIGIVRPDAHKGTALHSKLAASMGGMAGVHVHVNAAGASPQEAYSLISEQIVELTSVGHDVHYVHFREDGDCGILSTEPQGFEQDFFRRLWHDFGLRTVVICGNVFDGDLGPIQEAWGKAFGSHGPNVVLQPASWDSQNELAPTCTQAIVKVLGRTVQNTVGNIRVNDPRLLGAKKCWRDEVLKVIRCCREKHDQKEAAKQIRTPKGFHKTMEALGRKSHQPREHEVQRELLVGDLPDEGVLLESFTVKAASLISSQAQATSVSEIKMRRFLYKIVLGQIAAHAECMASKYYDQMFSFIWKEVAQWWGFENDVEKFREVLLKWTEEQDRRYFETLKPGVSAPSSDDDGYRLHTCHLVTGCLLKENFINMYVGGTVCAAAPMISAMITPCFETEFGCKAEDFVADSYEELVRRTKDHYETVDDDMDQAVTSALKETAV